MSAAHEGREQSIDREILGSAYTALIDRDFPSAAELRPRFVSNDFKRGRKVISVIEAELSKCASFDFSVAFVTRGGITPLLQTLRELERRGVPGRVLTTDYLTFSDPDALEKLDAFSNIEVRMYLTTNVAGRFGFHTKGYLFHYPNGIEKVLIGSSNLTGSALAVNREWNLELSSLSQGSLVAEVRSEFEGLWAEAEPLADVLATYRSMLAEKQAVLRDQKVVEFDQVRLEPNAMQLSFVHNLTEIIRGGATRALLISATGTGKTYASAFAVRHLNPRSSTSGASRPWRFREPIPRKPASKP